MSYGDWTGAACAHARAEFLFGDDQQGSNRVDGVAAHLAQGADLADTHVALGIQLAALTLELAHLALTLAHQTLILVIHIELELEGGAEHLDGSIGQAVLAGVEPDPEALKGAPRKTVRARLDETRAARKPVLRWTPGMKVE